jgi:hypothetical protein
MSGTPATVTDLRRDGQREHGVGVHWVDRMLNREGDRALGTQLYPARAFGLDGVPTPDQATEIIGLVSGPDLDVRVTRFSGLFVLVPTELSTQLTGAVSPSTVTAYTQFIDKTVESINVVLCELAFEGIVSAPASRVELSPCTVLDGHAVIASGSGGRETYGTRTVGMMTEIIRGTWAMASAADPESLNRINRARRALALASVSPTLPALTVGAYSNFSRYQLAEAAVDAWIVTEQLIDAMWHEKVATGPRSAPTAGGRVHAFTSAGSRIDALHRAGAIDDAERAVLDAGRDVRNELAHRALVSRATADLALAAMMLMLERRIGRGLARPMVADGVSY